MRYGIFSDVHANLEALEAVLGVFQEDNIDEYLCLGDLVGYAANPKECIERVKKLSLATVAGNHDRASVDLFPANYFNSMAQEAITWTKQKISAIHKRFLESLELIFQDNALTLTHLTLQRPAVFHYMIDSHAADKTFALLKTQVCFVGHSHVPGVFIKDRSQRIRYHQDPVVVLESDKQYIFNAGSVGQPRDGNPDAAYCVYDTKKQKVEIKRVKYDIRAAARKIIDAGLSEFLADRLSWGR